MMRTHYQGHDIEQTAHGWHVSGNGRGGDADNLADAIKMIRLGHLAPDTLTADQVVRIAREAGYLATDAGDHVEIADADPIFPISGTTAYDPATLAAITDLR